MTAPGPGTGARGGTREVAADALATAEAFSTVGLAALGALAYGLAESYAPRGTPLALAGPLLLAAAAARGWRARVSRGAVLAAALAAAALAAADWLLLTRDAVLALGRFLLLVEAVQLLALRSPRARGFVLLMSLFHLSAASILTTDLSFALVLAAYTVVGTWALAIRHQERTAPGAPMGARFLFGLSVVATGTLAATVAIFLVVPRVGVGLLQASRTVRVAGFGDSVRLGDFGEILRSSETVLRVTFPEGGDGPGIRFRGRVFEGYLRDGTAGWRWDIPGVAWRRQQGRLVSEPLVAGESGRLARDLQTQYVPEPRAVEVAQEILLSPLASRALFAAGPVRRFSIAQTGPVSHLFVYADPESGTLETQEGVRFDTEAVSYRVTSWLRPGTAEAAPFPPPRRPGTAAACRRLLAYPDDAAERLRSLAARWAGGDAADPIASARAIQRELRDSGAFEYTLDTPDPGDREPVDHFLTTTRRGHCEFFAAAMVLLLRSLDHPARLVTGFLGGEKNPVGGYRQVRSSDAHAWVEVLGPSGWETFDPTPRAPEGTGAFAFVGQLLDYARYRWYSGVVDYDLSDQRRALRRASESLAGFWNGLRGSPELLGREVLAARIGVAAGLLALGGLLVLGARRRSRGVPAPSVPFYAEMLRVLRRRGFRRAPAMTPREFADVVFRDGSPELAAPIGTLTDLFCRARYGAASLEPAETEGAAAALRALRAARNPSTSLGAGGNGHAPGSDRSSATLDPRLATRDLPR